MTDATTSEDSPREYGCELPDLAPRAALRLLAETADSWGAGWQADGERGGRLALPVLAGVRHGWVAGEVEVEAAGEGSRLVYRVEESAYQLDKASVLTLTIAACGALITVIGPLIPQLFRLVPIGILLSVAAWLFIVRRLRNSGPEEFFEFLADGPGENGSPNETGPSSPPSS